MSSLTQPTIKRYDTWMWPDIHLQRWEVVSYPFWHQFLRKSENRRSNQLPKQPTNQPTILDQTDSIRPPDLRHLSNMLPNNWIHLTNSLHPRPTTPSPQPPPKPPHPHPIYPNPHSIHPHPPTPVVSRQYDIDGNLTKSEIMLFFYLKPLLFNENE